MGDIKVKVGSKWNGKQFGDLDTKIEVKYVTQLDGKTFITYTKNMLSFGGNRETRLATSERTAFLAAYAEKEDFFVVGGEYKGMGYTHYVQEVFTVSNPINENHRRQARAVVINKDGKRWMEMLNKCDFEYVTRVK